MNTNPAFDWEAFFARGYFLGSPLFNKVWCLYDVSPHVYDLSPRVHDVSPRVHDVSPRGLTTGPREVTSPLEPSARGPAVEPRDDKQSEPRDDKQSELRDDITCFFRNDFDCSLKNPWLTGSLFEFNLEVFFAEILKFEATCPQINWQIQNQENYAKIFDKIKLGISNQIIQKAVPFHREMGNTHLEQKNLIHFFHKLIPLIPNKNLYFYGNWDFKNQKMHFGASPELLFVKNKNKITTIALAGTSTQPKKDFQNTKMKNEHDYVVYDLFSELKKYGDVKRHRAQTIQFNNYFHKKTKFSVNCENIQLKFEDLLSSVYPSAAIGAYPRLSGIAFLKKIEEQMSLKRGFFASPFGIQIASHPSRGVTSNFMLCLSTIRGIEWDAGQFTITAGGGVVAQSCFEHEWQEIGLKIQSIKSIFGL